MADCADKEGCKSYMMNKCHFSKHQKLCPLSCDVCESCTLGDWGEWTACSATCGGGGQTRARATECTQGDLTESRQCNLEPCPVDACALTDSDPVVVNDEAGKVIENKRITTSGAEPAIGVYDSADVVIRNVKIV